MSLGTAEPTQPAAPAPSSNQQDEDAPSETQPPVPSRSPWLARGALALGLLPLVVSALNLVLAVGSDYRPFGDQAMQELHIRDIGHHEVLVGLWSHPQWSHPGPLFFYMTAPLYWLTGHASIAMSLTTLAIVAGSIAGMALIAHRRGGLPLMLCTLLGNGLLVWAFGPDFLRDPWVTYVPTLPFALLVFLVWSLAAGETWALPVTAFVVSFLVQTHVGLLALAAPLAAVGALWLLVPGLRVPERRRATLRASALSVAVLAVVWLPPLLDVVLHTHSNPTRTKEWFERTRYEPHSLREGWRVVSSQFGWPWPWLSEPLLFNGLETHYVSRGVAPVLLLPLAAAAVLLWRRGPSDARRFVVVFGLTLGAGVLTIARTLGAVAEYRLGWTWVLAMLGFVLLTWAVWLLASAAGRRRAPWLEGRVLAPAALAGLVVLAGVNGLTSARADAPYAGDGEVVEALLEPILDDVDPEEGQVVVLEPHNGGGVPNYARGLVLQLEKHGVDARVPRPHMPFFSRSRVQRDGPVQAFYYVATDPAEIDELREDPGYRLVAEWHRFSREQQARFDAILEDVTAQVEAGTFELEDFVERSDLAELEDASFAHVIHAAAFLDLTPPTT